MESHHGKPDPAEASETLAPNKKLSLEAVQQHGSALPFACAELRSDKQVVMEAAESILLISEFV